MNLRIGLFLFLLGLIVTACVTSIDETLPYAALPTITLATDVDLVASPSDPTSIIANARVPAGAKLDVIGRDQDAAWFLVEYEKMLGWVPSFYSQTNVGTLDTPLVFEPLRLADSGPGRRSIPRDALPGGAAIGHQPYQAADPACAQPDRSAID